MRSERLRLPPFSKMSYSRTSAIVGTFTIPKMLRPYFMHRRELLSDLARLAFETIQELMGEAVGDENVRPGVVAVPQTFGSVLQPMRSCLFSRRNRRSSSRSAVVSPSLRRPSSRSACRTEFRIVWADGSNSLASAPARKFDHVFSCGHGQGCGSGVEPRKEIPEILACELLLEGSGDFLVMGLEAEDPGFGRLEGGTVVGRPGLSLEDGEVDLDLVEPAGVDGQVDQAQVGPAALEPLD